jgi:hypothetical protein
LSLKWGHQQRWLKYLISLLPELYNTFKLARLEYNLKEIQKTRHTKCMRIIYRSIISFIIHKQKFNFRRMLYGLPMMGYRAGAMLLCCNFRKFSDNMISVSTNLRIVRRHKTKKHSIIYRHSCDNSTLIDCR